MFNHGAVVLERVTFSQEVVVSPCGGGLGWWIRCYHHLNSKVMGCVMKKTVM
jgi:hypothetical protein